MKKIPLKNLLLKHEVDFAFFTTIFFDSDESFFATLFRVFYGGNKFTDPIDGSSYRKFLPYGYGKTLRPNALCPGHYPWNATVYYGFI